MAKSDLLPLKIKVPELKLGSMSHSQPYQANADVQTALDLPSELIDNWKVVALETLGVELKQSRALRVYLDSCIKCGACTDKCHYFLGTGDPNNMPVARQDLLRKVYRRYFTVAGKLVPKLVGAEDLTEDVIDDWYRYFHQCSQCRRCASSCPIGIDTAEISMVGRRILDKIGLGQKYSNQIISKALTKGNNLGLPGPALADTLEGLEEDIVEETGINVKLPLDQANADILLVTPSADFFAEPHVDGLIGYAKVFHEAGLSWTISSFASEAANFGLFTGNKQRLEEMAERIVQAANELKVRRIVFGECGHAWRVACNYLPPLLEKVSTLDRRYPVPQHIVEVTHQLIEAKQITLDASKNDHRRITFHDSCNVARASQLGDVPNGQLTIPREVLQASCNYFFDMAPNTTGQNTFCCGGGGGLLTDELSELRTAGAKPRMSAFQALHKKHGITHMAAMCAICKSQFAQVFPHYGFALDQVISVHQIVGDALVMTKS